MPTPAFICEAATRAARRGRDLLHLAARHPGPARGARALPRAALRPAASSPSASTSRSAACRRSQIAVRMAAGDGRRGADPDAGLAEFRAAPSTVAGARAGRRADAQRARRLEPRPRPARAMRSRRARAPSSSTRRPTRPAGRRRARSFAAILDLARRARPVDHRRRDLRPLRLRPGAHGRGRTPSFHDVMDDDDRVLFVQTFSKNWAMTGWRIGWLEAPPALGPVDREPHPVFHLRRRHLPAACARSWPSSGARASSTHQIARARRGRAIVCEGLGATGRVELPPPAGAFYAFFKVPRRRTTRASSPCGSSTRPMSGSRPGPPSGPAARPICGSASLARRRICRRRCAAWLPCFKACPKTLHEGCGGAAGADRRRLRRRDRVPHRRAAGAVAVRIDGRRRRLGARRLRAADAAGARRRGPAHIGRHHGRGNHARGLRGDRQVSAQPRHADDVGHGQQSRFDGVADADLGLARGTTRCSPRCPAACRPCSPSRRTARPA